MKVAPLERLLCAMVNVITKPTDPPKLRPARLDDYEDIRRLGWAYALDIPRENDWQRLWLDNPLRTHLGTDLPIGWVLETRSGEIVGTMGTVHMRYRFRGEDLISAVSRAWFVRDSYRAFALELMDEYLHQPGVDLFINNAVSVPALSAFSSFCDRIPLGRWDTMSFFVTGHHGFAQRKLVQRNWPLPHVLAYPVSAYLRLKERMGMQFRRQTVGGSSIDATDHFDARFDAFWSERVKQNPTLLLADRTSAALTWHFGAPMRSGRLWVLTATHHGRLQAYCTFVRHDHAFRLPALPHNDAQGIRAVRLIDYQSLEPDVELLPDLLAAALERCAKEDVHILENFGRGVPKMQAVDEAAPYRERLSNWKFFYHAADPQMHAVLRDPQSWDPSAYDGDAGLE